MGCYVAVPCLVRYLALISERVDLSLLPTANELRSIFEYRLVGRIKSLELISSSSIASDMRRWVVSLYSVNSILIVQRKIRSDCSVQKVLQFQSRGTLCARLCAIPPSLAKIPLSAPLPLHSKTGVLGTWEPSDVSEFDALDLAMAHFRYCKKQCSQDRVLVPFGW